MREYVTSLRITGKSFNYDELVSIIGITPNQYRIFDKEDKKFQSAALYYRVDKLGRKKIYKSFDRGLQDLLEILLPIKNRLDLIEKKGYRKILWCGHFTDEFDGGPIISRKTLDSLSKLGVPLFIDTYCWQRKE